MGFDETDDYKNHIESLIDLVSSGNLFGHPVPKRFFVGEAIALAQGLTYPATVEDRDKLYMTARSVMPEALRLAEIILLIFKKQYPLSLQDYTTALTYLLDMLGVPKESLQISFLDRISPNFRSHIIA